MPVKRLSLLLAAALSLAACTPMNGRDGPEGGRPPGTGGDDAGGAPSVVAGLQDQLQRTAEGLRLTAAQAVLWDVYQDKVGALMADQLKLPPYRTARQTAPQQISQKIEVVRNRLTAMEDIQEAANKLYAALDETQKKFADQALAQTVPALYSGLGSAGGGNSGEPSGHRAGPGGAPRGGMGGPGGMGGGMGGGFGGM